MVEKSKPIREGTCFYIHSLGEDGQTDTGLVLEAATKDKYAPKKTGVYNVFLSKKVVGKKAQTWQWNKGSTTLSPLLYPKKALFEGTNKNLIIYKNRRMK